MGEIKFFHHNETLVYKIKKCFCKVVFLNNKHTLVVEVESSDDLEHVEEDSLQNQYPQVVLSIEDFEIQATSVLELEGMSFEIPMSEFVENENAEEDEVFYTSINLNDEELLDTDKNKVRFYKNEKSSDLRMNWEGVCEDFLTTQKQIRFQVDCRFPEDYQQESDFED